jgi:hypothetical protein
MLTPSPISISAVGERDGQSMVTPGDIMLIGTGDLGNEQAQRFDGIERIESDGTVVRVDGSALKPQDIEQTAVRLMSFIRR